MSAKRLTGARAQIIAAIMASLAAVVVAALSNWDRIFAGATVEERLENEFYITNERGENWTVRFSVRGRYQYQPSTQSIRLQIEEGRISALEDGYLTRLTFSACYEIGQQPWKYDVYPSLRASAPSQEVLLSRHLKSGQSTPIEPTILTIPGIDEGMQQVDPWLCAFLWTDIDAKGFVGEGNAPAHDLHLIRLKF